jgi:signal transduction histidine kinase
VRHHVHVESKRRETALLAAVLVVQVLGPHTSRGDVSGLAGGLGALSALGQVLLLLRRRVQPLPVAVGVLALYAGQCVAIDVVPPVPFWVALVALVGRSSSRTVGSVTAAGVTVLAVGEALHPQTGLALLLAGLTVAIALLALLRQSERGRMEAVRSQAATEERLRIARDLHDLAGHGLGVVAIQSSTARMALDQGDGDTARRALEAVETSSRSALKEMRQLLGVLRGGDTAPAPGLAEVQALVDGVRASGTPVTADIGAMEVPPGVALCVYRVVQEALTNAVKHSPHAPIELEVATGETVQLRILSRGEPWPAAGQGSGLDGIRTRVEALGGTTTIGPVPAGWLVEAELPLEAS